MEFDKVIHEPARLRIMMILTGSAEADFNFLRTTLDLTRGNLSKHIEKLESAGYLNIHKSFNGKVPHTRYQMTHKGSQALLQYWERIDAVRQLGGS